MSSIRFEKLRNSKREKIIEAAIDEFVIKGYDRASVNGIIKRAEISRGSFYTYFADKADIFNYVIHSFNDKSSDFIVKTLIEEKGDIIDMIIKLYEIHGAFAKGRQSETRALGLVNTVGEALFTIGKSAAHSSRSHEFLLFFQTESGRELCEKLQENSKEYLKKYSKEKFADLVELLFVLGFKSVVAQTIYPEKKQQIREQFIVQLGFIRNGIESD